MNNSYSSKTITEEIKYRIKEKYKNQENFGKEIGVSRKTINRLLNHSEDISLLFKVCEILGIDYINIK